MIFEICTEAIAAIYWIYSSPSIYSKGAKVVVVISNIVKFRTDISGQKQRPNEHMPRSRDSPWQWLLGGQPLVVFVRSSCGEFEGTGTLRSDLES